MKLVHKTNDINAANDILHLLESNGIPSMLSENSMANRGTHIPNGNEIRIHLSHQFEDAKNLIENPEYEVKNPVNMELFYKQMSSNAEKEALNMIYKKIIKLTLILLSGAVLLVYFVASK